MKKKGKTAVRILSSTLPFGNKLALVTDLPAAITAEDLTNIYYQRWENGTLCTANKRTVQ